MFYSERQYLKRRYKFIIFVVILAVFFTGTLTATIRRLIPNLASISYDYSGKIDETAREGIYYGTKVDVPEALLVSDTQQVHVLGVANPSERWIEVDLSEQKLRAWDGNSLFLESLVSTGLPWWPTPTGEYRIWLKVRATRMEGGEGRYYYNLPNVPYVMFYENDQIPGWRGYSLHGTYWHNDFGRVHSHGCVNLPTPIAEKLYYWTTPTLPEGKGSVYSSPDNPGTRIVIHD
jgi:lipoprotein-anchoring transpeptidase ErfK/SrfK